MDYELFDDRLKLSLEGWDFGEDDPHLKFSSSFYFSINFKEVVFVSQWLGIVKFLTRNGFTPIAIIGIVLAVGLVIALIILATGKTNQ